MSAKLRRLRSPDSRISFRKVEEKDREFSFLERDLKDVKGGFAEEFPLLCAIAGTAVVPQVMVLDPDSGKPVPLLSQSVPIEEIQEKRSIKSSAGKSAGSVSSSTSASDPFSVDPSCPPLTPYVIASFDDDEKQDTLRKLVFKGFPLDDGIIMALGTIIAYYDYLECLYIHRARLTASLLRKLVKYLSLTKKIREIILDENPISEQNFFLFLQEDTKLERLTLRKCEINDFGVSQLAQHLKYKDPPEELKLSYLNLAENNIGDIGLSALAYGLRSNRTLLELVLTKNVVGDPGASALAAIGMKFALDAEELKNRKRRADEHNKLRDQMVEERLNELIRSPERASLGQTRKSGRYQSVSITDEVRQQIEAEVDKRLSIDSHPYSWDARPDGLDMWCIGNFQLKEIYLDYNKIGMIGVQKFFDTLEYQIKLKEDEGRDNNSGLICVRLEGNALGGRESSLEKIQEILTRHIRAMHPPKHRRRQERRPLACKHGQAYKDGVCLKCNPREPSLNEIVPKDETRKSAHSVAIGSTLIPRSPFLESSARKSERKRYAKSATQKKDSSYDVIRRFSFV